jgi:hypothetical protein
MPGLVSLSRRAPLRPLILFLVVTALIWSGLKVSAQVVSGVQEFTIEVSEPTVQFVGAAVSQSWNSRTVTIPPHRPGDLIIMFVYREGTTSTFSSPAGWTNLVKYSGVSSPQSLRASTNVSYRYSTTGYMSSGTWGTTSSTSYMKLAVLVYRNAQISNTVASNRGSGRSVTWLANNAFPADGLSLRLAGHNSENINPAISGAATRVNSSVGGLSAYARLYAGEHIDSGQVSKSSSGTSSGWISHTLRLSPL